MRALIQRVSRASVSVEGHVVAAIKQGLVVLVGVGKGEFVEVGVGVLVAVGSCVLVECGWGVFVAVGRGVLVG